MQKTKLGISVGLFGAALYFVGLISIIPLVVMAGFVLLFEENEWLKRTAVKAVGVVLFFTILSSIVGLVGNSSSLLENFVLLFRGSIDLAWLNRVLSIVRTAISFAQTLFLLMLGFKALKQGNVKLGSVDNAINKHM
ncbi:MAG: hypothetical protein FWD99_05860 [Oscillospiraceae bacterium]|nr:hypothetical protein [Oscillospiraceae bacterium]